MRYGEQNNVKEKVPGMPNFMEAFVLSLSSEQNRTDIRCYAFYKNPEQHFIAQDFLLLCIYHPILDVM